MPGAAHDAFCLFRYDPCMIFAAAQLNAKNNQSSCPAVLRHDGFYEGGARTGPMLVNLDVRDVELVAQS
jgi:hypothetical protein